MIGFLITTYCDYMIASHKYIKSLIEPETLEHYILSLKRADAFIFLNDCNRQKIKVYPTRIERYQLYKLLKGKNSSYILYSYGKEKCDTRKYLIIKKK